MSGFSRSLWEFAFGRERMMMPKYAGRAVRRPSIRRAGAARDVVVRVTQDGTRTSPVSEIAIPAPSPRRARSRLRGGLGRDASACLGFAERARAERRARRRDGRPGRVSDPRDARGMTSSAKRVFATSMPSLALLAATARACVRRMPSVHRARNPVFPKRVSGRIARATADSFAEPVSRRLRCPGRNRRGAASSARRAAPSSATSVVSRRVPSQPCIARTRETSC